MSLSGQLRIAILSAVTLTILLAQFVVAGCDSVIGYLDGRDHVNRVTAAILGQEDTPGSRDLLAGVQAQPSVIAATLQQPAGEVLWTFDRNAPQAADVVTFGRAPPLTESRTAWYEQNRLDPDLRGQPGAARRRCPGRTEPAHRNAVRVAPRTASPAADAVPAGARLGAGTVCGPPAQSPGGRTARTAGAGDA
jgi:hypothetical protein